MSAGCAGWRAFRLSLPCQRCSACVDPLFTREAVGVIASIVDYIIIFAHDAGDSGVFVVCVGEIRQGRAVGQAVLDARDAAGCFAEENESRHWIAPHLRTLMDVPGTPNSCGQ